MKNLNKEIAAIAFPAIISNITTPLLAMIDIAIVGHIGSAAFIGAIAVGASMFNMLYWLFGFLRMGASGLTAQAFGAGDKPAAGTILYRALSVGVLVGIILYALSIPIADFLLRFMDADTETQDLARTYFLIAVSGAPATLGTFALSGWFLGMQDSKSTMWMALITNIANIIISLTLVFGIGMQIKGVATGSAIAQWCGFLFGLVRAIHGYHPVRPQLSHLLKFNELKRFFAINADIFLRTLCLVAVTVWFTRSGAQQGVEILAANALLLQLFMFFSYFMDGFAFAGEALAGKYTGRCDYGSLKHVIRNLLKIGITLAILFAVGYLCFGNAILCILTDDQSVIDVCGHYLYWAIAVPVAGTTAFIWDGILIGLTKTRIMLLSMASATIIFFTTYFITRSFLGNHGLWLAFILYLAARGIAEQILYTRTKVSQLQ